jgi:DNA-binding beta-propeller fold protein YncE
MNSLGRRFSLILVTLLLTLVLFLVVNTVQAVQVVNSIPVIGQPKLTYDSYKGEIWLTTYENTTNMLGMHVIEPSNIVTAISDSDYSSIASVTVNGGFSSGIAYDSALHEIWVINENFDTVTIISDTSNSVVATIDLNYTSSYTVYDHFGISCIVYDSGKGEMFVSNFVSGYVSVILDSTRQVVATIPLGNDPYPTSLIYDSSKGEIFVCYDVLSGKNNASFISVISDDTNSVVATVPLDNRTVNRGVYDYANGEIYATCRSDSSLLVISDVTNTVVGSIPLEYSPFGDVGFDPVKSILLVGTLNGMTYVISDKTNSVVETAPISSVSMVYDSGRNMMVDIGSTSIQFISDELSPTPSPSPSVPDFSWLMILPLLLILLFIVVLIRNGKLSDGYD